ncbi:O-antigen ligase family protein [Hymenobacter sp. CRA2]|uniref:O-antigen ligase family protein n=1 Tax=Hymenobacter sp. CRA2 TaxID=1955620 RepID=UPI00098F93E9|nr:O-antigen ligase family protein [Hymenobacter sp. CRA2]OON65686.1 hypothetical protein B0919_23720 [Hymenobacter sp. CRA2]
MKIRLQFLYLVAILAVLMTDQVFWEYFVKTPDDPLLRYYNFGISGLSFGVALLYYRYMERHVRWWFWLVNVALALLALESYSGWGSWMVYPHVFEKLLVLWLIFGVYAFHQRFGPPPMRLLVYVILAALLGNLIFYHPNALSMSAFLEHDRGVTAPSALLLVPVVLLTLGWYLERGSPLNMFLFYLSMALVVFLQHRSVWVTTAVCVPVLLLLLARLVPQVSVSLHKLALLAVIPLVLSTVGGVAAVVNDPSVMRKLESNIEDITNADKQGTGSWRVRQTQAYVPLVQQRPVAGWRLEGFDLPMQFYDPASDMPMWADHTGHHFHSFYMDRLFYFGVLGVLLVLVFPIIQLVRYLRYPGGATVESSALLAFFCGLLVYSISYDWSPYQFGLLGLMMAAAEAQLRPVPAKRPLPLPVESDEPLMGPPALA